MEINKQEYWTNNLHGFDKIKAVWWSSFSKKRYFLFEEYLNWGKAARAAFKDVNEMTMKSVKTEYWKIKHEKTAKLIKLKYKKK